MITKLIEALSIIERRSASPTIWATHDELWIYADPDLFSAEELAALDGLGWAPGEDSAGDRGMCAVFKG